MTTISQMEALVATVEAGSLAKAARGLNLTPSAVSKQLTALESELGVVLLERRPRILEITESGQVFYQRCKQILVQIDSAEREAQVKRDDLSGMIRLTVATPLVRSKLPKLLQEFGHQHPAIRFHLQVNDEIEDLVTGRIDFAFRIGKLADNRLHAIPLAEVHPIFCASPSYIHKYGKPHKIADLEHHQLMLLSTLNLSTLFSRVFGSTKQVEHFHTANDINMILALMRKGLCISAMLDIMIGGELKKGELIHLFSERVIPGKKLYLVYAKQGVLPKKLRLFKQHIKEEWF